VPTGHRVSIHLAADDEQISPDGVAFTGEGKLVRKATGYEQQTAEPRSPTSGSRLREPSFRRRLVRYRLPADSSDAAKGLFLME